MSKKTVLGLCFVFTGLLLSACGVEVRDRDSHETTATRELIVEGEYAVPIPEDRFQQVELHYDRLVLRPQSTFITNGLNIKIHVGELVSEGGTMATFPERSFAAAENPGRDGGKLDLHINQAHGSLLVRMQGESGGSGAAGREPDAALTGPPGTSGNAARPMLNGASFGIIPATSGGPGGPGLPGYEGVRGLKGGDSGFAFIHMNGSEDFELKVQKSAGAGGQGGIGGAGGAGGPGGAPGNENLTGPNTARNYTAAGAQGPQGPRGSQGPQGPAGVIQKVCVKKGTLPVDCESY